METNCTLLQCKIDNLTYETITIIKIMNTVPQSFLGPLCNATVPFLPSQFCSQTIFLFDTIDYFEFSKFYINGIIQYVLLFGLFYLFMSKEQQPITKSVLGFPRKYSHLSQSQSNHFLALLPCILQKNLAPAPAGGAILTTFSLTLLNWTLCLLK